LESAEEDDEDAICVNIEGVLKNEKLQGWVYCETTVLPRKKWPVFAGNPLLK
jgi:hypothetical protein